MFAYDATSRRIIKGRYMDEERKPTKTKDEPASKGKNFEISRKSAGIGVLTVVVALLLGLGGYLVGKNGGEDLGQARA